MNQEILGSVFIVLATALYIAAKVIDPHYHHIPGAEALSNRATLSFLLGAVLILGPRVRNWFANTESSSTSV